jgi:hypothetical protein
MPTCDLLVRAVGDDVVDLEDQLHHLRGQQHLLLLPDYRDSWTVLATSANAP